MAKTNWLALALMGAGGGLTGQDYIGTYMRIQQQKAEAEKGKSQEEFNRWTKMQGLGYEPTTRESLEQRAMNQPIKPGERIQKFGEQYYMKTPTEEDRLSLETKRARLQKLQQSEVIPMEIQQLPEFTKAMQALNSGADPKKLYNELVSNVKFRPYAKQLQQLLNISKTTRLEASDEIMDFLEGK